MVKGPEPESLVGRVIDGRFRVEEVIAQGGMGTVYRAQQLTVERVVAIKVLRTDRRRDRQAVAQFRREASVISQLTSPHTVGLIDVGTLDGGDWFLAMEHLVGETLRSRLARGPLALDDALRFADQIALSLAEAHTRGIVHRDLKPANIFLAETPGHVEVAKVLDFGIASLTSATTAAHIAGTPKYMAPETLTGGRPAPTADVGLVLYEMLVGAHPFEDLDGEQLLDAHLDQPCPPLPEGVPEPVAELVTRSLAKHPRLRPADGAAFRRQLRGAQGLPEEASSARAPGSTSSAPPASDDTEATKPSTLTLTLARMRAMVRPPPQTPWWRRWAPVAVAVAVVALGWSARGGPIRRAQSALIPRLSVDAPNPAPVIPATAAPEAEKVEVMIHTVPDRATLRIDGMDRGETPQLVRLVRGAEVEVELVRAGYASERFVLTPERDTKLRKTLRRKLAKPPPPDPVDSKIDHYLDEPSP